MQERVLAARGLEKAYKGRRVVSGVDLEVGSGQVVGLLGPNGAGKTTTFHLVVGLIQHPGAGQARPVLDALLDWARQDRE